MKDGLLPTNVMHFGRLLRRAGLPVGPADLLAAQDALTRIDLGVRPQARAALRSTLIHRHEHADLFEQAFSLFWRDPEAARHAAAMDLLDGRTDKPPERAPPGRRRLAEAMREKTTPAALDRREESIEVALAVSERERLQQMDFEAMGADEIARAKAVITRLVLPLDLRRTRRRRLDPAGSRPDLGATLRNSFRLGGEIIEIAATKPVTRPPPLVALCDISGSMARYSQILLHFLHAVANDRERVTVFLFGTRLSNVTRALRHRDAEVAFQMISHLVPDFSGGTRIGEALATFNRTWSRRVLGQGAVVLLVTDGLDRDGAAGLPENMERLHKSCSRLVWLNPLLRWDGFAPRAQGPKAMLPHVDEFRPVHNLASLGALVSALSRPMSARSMDRWRSP